MNLDEAIARLQALGTEKVREMNSRNGASPDQFGVKLGDLRTLANEIKANPELATALWQTGNSDAQLLSVLLMKPKQIPADDMETMVASATYTQLADWLNSYVVKVHPEKETLRQRWLQSPDPMLGRAGWSLTADRLAKTPQGLDLEALLNRIETEMPTAPTPVQWTMNSSLAAIGIHFPEYRERALAIGEKLGIYRDYPVSKGCTSPFAPIWITEMVSRQG